MVDFHGVFPYLVSPIDASGQIRSEVLGRLCGDLIKSGVHGLTPLGSTGAFAYLNLAQRAAVVQTTIEAAKGRVPVVAGVASTSTTDAWRRRRRIKNSALTAFSPFCLFPARRCAGRILFPRHRRCGRYFRGESRPAAGGTDGG